MSSEYLARLFQQRSLARIIRFDEQIIPQAGLDDLELDLWERFLTPQSRDEREDFLAKLHMARTDDEGTLRPTVAGVLMASKDPREWLPNAYVQAVFYRGVDIRTDQSTAPYQLDARRYCWSARCSGRGSLSFRGKEHEGSGLLSIWGVWTDRSLTWRRSLKRWSTRSPIGIIPFTARRSGCGCSATV